VIDARGEVVRALTLLGAQWNRQIVAELVDAWCKGLAHLDADAIRYATQRWVEDGTQFPTMADLRGIAADRLSQREAQDEAERGGTYRCPACLDIGLLLVERHSHGQDYAMGRPCRCERGEPFLAQSREPGRTIYKPPTRRELEDNRRVGREMIGRLRAQMARKGAA